MPDFYDFLDKLDAPYRNKFESLNKEDKEQIVGKFFLGTQHINILGNIVRNYTPKEKNVDIGALKYMQKTSYVYV